MKLKVNLLPEIIYKAEESSPSLSISAMMTVRLSEKEIDTYKIRTLPVNPLQILEMLEFWEFQFCTKYLLLLTKCDRWSWAGEGRRRQSPANKSHIFLQTSDCWMGFLIHSSMEIIGTEGLWHGFITSWHPGLCQCLFAPQMFDLGPWKINGLEHVWVLFSNNHFSGPTWIARERLKSEQLGKFQSLSSSH